MLGGVRVVIADRRVAGGDQLRIGREAGVGQRLAVALEAVAPRHGRRGAGDIADPAVTELDEMFGGEHAGAAVVDADAVHRRRAALTGGHQVEGHHGEAAAHQLGEMAEVEGRRAGDDAADAEAEEILGIAPLPRGVAQAVAEHHLEAPGLRRDLDGAGERAVKRVRHRRHEQADHRDEAGLELARRPARPIAQLLDRLLDAPHGLRPHPVGPAVQQVGHRAHGGPRQGGDVADARLIGHVHFQPGAV